MDEMKSTNISIEPQYEVKPELSVSRFVKVFMQGELVGRKINMATHNSYASLSFTLKKLGNNFSMPSWELNGMLHNEEDGALDGNSFVIFHDTVDGGRFFLGEVPWEVFMVSVKRIYIVRVQENVADNKEEEGETPDAIIATSDARQYGDDAPGNDDEGNAVAAGSFDDGDVTADAASADDWAA